MDGLQEVVEVVGDAARELTQRLHLLALQESRLRLDPRGHFVAQALIGPGKAAGGAGDEGQQQHRHQHHQHKDDVPAPGLGEGVGSPLEDHPAQDLPLLGHRLDRGGPSAHKPGADARRPARRLGAGALVDLFDAAAVGVIDRGGRDLGIEQLGVEVLAHRDPVVEAQGGADAGAEHFGADLHVAHLAAAERQLVAGAVGDADGQDQRRDDPGGPRQAGV